MTTPLSLLSATVLAQTPLEGNPDSSSQASGSANGSRSNPAKECAAEVSKALEKITQGLKDGSITQAGADELVRGLAKVLGSVVDILKACPPPAGINAPRTRPVSDTGDSLTKYFPILISPILLENPAVQSAFKNFLRQVELGAARGGQVAATAGAAASRSGVSIFSRFLTGLSSATGALFLIPESSLGEMADVDPLGKPKTRRKAF